MTMGRTDGVLDETALDRLLRIGGQDFLLEMIDLFLENAPQRLSSAREALQSGDVHTFYRAAHSLKSTAANLGGRQLQATAERAEERANAKDGDALPPLLTEMEREYDHLRERLEAERGRRRGA